MSKLTLSLFGFAIAAFALAAIFWLTRPVSPGQLTVQKGQAFITRSGQQISVSDQVELKAFDDVSIPKEGLATLNLSDGSLVRIASETQLVIKQITYIDQLLNRAQFKLLEGQVWGNVRSLEPEAVFEVETPTIVAAVRGTRFSVGYREARSRVFVAEDQVAVARLSHPKDFNTLKTNQFIILNDATLDADFEAGPKSVDESIFGDDWFEFNQHEDGFTSWPPKPEVTTIEPEEVSQPIPPSSPEVKGVHQTKPTLQSPPPIETLPPPVVPEVLEPVLIDLEISYEIISPNDRTAQFTVMAVYDDGSTQDMTLDADWSVDPKGLGSITSAGFYFAGLRAGDTVYASYGSQTVSSDISI